MLIEGLFLFRVLTVTIWTAGKAAFFESKNKHWRNLNVVAAAANVS